MALLHRLRVVSPLMCVLLVSAVAMTAHATVMRALSLQELVAHSDRVVVARVLSQRSAWNDDHSNIHTFTTVRVDQFLKGSGSRELVIRQLGGRVGAVNAPIEGSAVLTQGETAIVFLRNGPGVSFFTAMNQSVYHVEGSNAVRDLTGSAFVSSSMQPIEMPSHESVAVSTLISQVRAFSRSAR